jgi:hypothetical protein
VSIKNIIMENITESKDRKIYIVSSKRKTKPTHDVVDAVLAVMKKQFPKNNITVKSTDDDYIDIDVYGNDVDLSQALMAKGKLEKEISDIISLPTFVSLVM